MVVNSYLPQPQFRPNKALERTTSTNVAVNGVSMPTSDGKAHRHGPLLKDQSPSSTSRNHHHHRRQQHRASPSEQRQKSRSTSRGRSRTIPIPTSATAEAAGTTTITETRRPTTPSRRSKTQTRQQLQHQQQEAVRSQQKQQQDEEPAVRSGAGTLDAFMQQKLEQKHVSLKQLGASLRRLQRDEARDDDGLTHVAVSYEEPPVSENDQSNGNRKKASKTRAKEARRAERGEKAIPQVKAGKERDQRYIGATAAQSKSQSLTVVTDIRPRTSTDGNLRVDEALRLFEQKYKLNAPDVDGTSHEAQAGISPGRKGRKNSEELVRAVASSPSVNAIHKAAPTLPSNERPPSSAKSLLLPTTEPARHGTGAVVPATSSLSSGDIGTTTILRCIGSGDDQRSSGASTTIRRLEHKGKRYKEVITVVSKSDESNANGSAVEETNAAPVKLASAHPPVMNTRIIIEDLTKSPMVKPKPLSVKVDKTKDVKACESAELSLLKKKVPVVKQVAAPAPTTATVKEGDPATEPQQVQATAAQKTVEEILGGQESPTYQAVLSTFQDTPSRSTAKGGWLGFGRMITPRWLPRRTPAGTPKTPDLQGGGKVTPLIAMTHRLQSASDVDRNISTASLVGATQKLAPKTEADAIVQEEKGATTAEKDDDDADDDASSLFNFHSANSSDKELGDIFSFISSRKGSRDINEGKAKPLATAHKDSILLVSPRRAGSTKKASDQSRDVVSADAIVPAVLVTVPAEESLPKVDDSEKSNGIVTPSKQKRNNAGLRIVTARSRKEQLLSFLSARNRQKDDKAEIRKSGFKSALLPLLKKERQKQEVRNVADKSVTEVTPSKVTRPQPVEEKSLAGDEIHAQPPNKEVAFGGDDATPNPADAPLSPIGAISQDLTQSTSMESNSTGGMFGISTFLNSMCGPDKKCEVEQPLPWRDCGQVDDDHSLVDDETDSQHKEVDESIFLPHAKTTLPEGDNSIVEESNYSESERAATTSPKTTEGVDAIETVLHTDRKTDPMDLSPLRRVLSTGNLSVANGSLFNVRVSLRYLRGLYASFNKSNSSAASNRSVITGFVRVSKCSALASCSLDIARSRPVNLMSLCDKAGSLPPVVWSSKRVLDRRRGRLYFSVVLKQLLSGGVPIAFSHERVRLVFGLQRGDETIELGSASFEVDGSEITQKRIDLPLQNGAEAAKKTPFLVPLRRTTNHNSFSGDRHDFSLLSGSVLSARIDVKAGDHDMAGPLVWEDCILADDDSFDDSYVPSLCEEPSQAEHYDSVEVVPLPRGAAIISKNGYLEGCAGTLGRSSPANESLSSLQKKEQRVSQNNRRRISNLFARKKPKKAMKSLPSAVKAPMVIGETVDNSANAEPGIATDPPEEDASSFLSPMSESHSDCSFSAVASNEDESSGGESSSVSSKKRATLTDKAADWVYRGARAAGFFSYSSDEEKMTQFSFGTKDDTHNYPTSDLSESVMTDEASEVVIEQLKYWIQNETSTSLVDEQVEGGVSTPRTNTYSRVSLTEVLRSKLNETEGNPQQSLDHFKKILLLAQRLNLSPYDLIRRLENGENIEDLLHSK